ncbi:hypothetical protein [Corynebacterium sp. NML130628]|uniref:hypothetical protein n=1 Tax=Corynebacterium sp. NML130628 TaxID=1906333 RepID=UPI000AEA2F97|nr:hypothetical protein [Corynebacterium sp. NML130628]
MASAPALAAFGEAPESGNTDATTSAINTATTEADREISADHDDTDIVFAQGVIDAQGPEIDRMNAMLGAWGPQPLPREDYYNPIATLCGFTGDGRLKTQICSQIR